MTTGPSEGRVLARDETTVREPISDRGGARAEVAALSRALSRFAFELATALRLAAEPARTSQNE
jgi:hypothetical protein